MDSSLAATEILETEKGYLAASLTTVFIVGAR